MKIGGVLRFGLWAIGIITAVIVVPLAVSFQVDVFRWSWDVQCAREEESLLGYLVSFLAMVFIPLGGMSGALDLAKGPHKGEGPDWLFGSYIFLGVGLSYLVAPISRAGYDFGKIVGFGRTSGFTGFAMCVLFVGLMIAAYVMGAKWIHENGYKFFKKEKK